MRTHTMDLVLKHEPFPSEGQAPKIKSCQFYTLLERFTFVYFTATHKSRERKHSSGWEELGGSTPEHCGMLGNHGASLKPQEANIFSRQGCVQRPPRLLCQNKSYPVLEEEEESTPAGFGLSWSWKHGVSWPRGLVSPGESHCFLAQEGQHPVQEGQVFMGHTIVHGCLSPTAC